MLEFLSHGKSQRHRSFSGKQFDSDRWCSLEAVPGNVGVSVDQFGNQLMTPLGRAWIAAAGIRSVDVRNFRAWLSCRLFGGQALGGVYSGAPRLKFTSTFHSSGTAQRRAAPQLKR